MKISSILNVVLAASLAVVSARLATSGGSSELASTGSSKAVIENIMTRTSVRDFTDQPVEEDKVETLLRAAMAAPTAVNKQPWRFIIIRDKSTLKDISENFRSMAMAQKAPLAVVVCGDLGAALGGEASEYWVQDASAATENLLLAAHGLGLGAVWCGIYPIQERVETLRGMLALPDSIIPLNVIPIGYPAENPVPKDKWKPGNIHHETW